MTTLYRELKDYLSKGRNKKDRPSLNNTRVHVLDDGRIGIKLHDTDVLKVDYENVVELNTGGYYTNVTKDRINHYLPSGIYVYPLSGIWYLKVDGESYGYRDGIKIDLDSREVFDADGNIGWKEDVKKRILKYSKKYAKAFVDGEVPAPGGGDCWSCHLVDENGFTMGEATDDNSHLLTHFEEDYFVPSLLLTAIKRVPTSPIFKNNVFSIWAGKSDNVFRYSNFEGEVRLVLRCYLYNRFEIGSRRTVFPDKNLLEEEAVSTW